MEYKLHKFVYIEAVILTPGNAIHGSLPGSGCLPGTLQYGHGKCAFKIVASSTNEINERSKAPFTLGL